MTTDDEVKRRQDKAKAVESAIKTPQNVMPFRHSTGMMPAPYGLNGSSNPDIDGLPFIGQLLSAMTPDGRRATVAWIAAMYPEAFSSKQ